MDKFYPEKVALQNGIGEVMNFPLNCRKLFVSEIKQTQTERRKENAMSTNMKAVIFTPNAAEDVIMKNAAWKTLPVIEAASMEDLMKRLADEGFVLGWTSGQLCRKIAPTFSLPTEPVDVALVQNKDVGLDSDTPVADFYDHVAKAGYKLLTPEMGMVARLAYKIVNRDKWWICIGMAPVEVDGKLWILRIAVGTKGPRLDAVEFKGMSGEREYWLFRP